MVMTYQSFGPWIYGQEWVVAKILGPEESIQDKIDQITDAGSTKRYGILVAPGIYNEDVAMIPYVDVVCSSGEAVIKPEVGDDTGVTMASNSTLAGFKVDMTNGATTGIAIGDLVEVIVEGCWVTNGGAGDVGITDASTGTSVRIRHCRIDSAATGYQKTAAGTTRFTDNRVTCADNGTDVDMDLGTLELYDNELLGQGTGYNLDVAGAACTVNSYRNAMTNANTTGAGIRIGDSDSAWVYSHEDSFFRVTHSGSGHMVCAEDVQTFYLRNGMKISDATSRINTLGDASDTKRYVIHLFAGEYSTVSIPEFVDLIGESRQTCVLTATGDTVLNTYGNTRIQSLRIELISSTDGDIALHIQTGRVYLEDVFILVNYASGTGYGVRTSDDGNFRMYNCEIQCAHASVYPVYHDGSEIAQMYDCILTNTSSTGYCVWVGSGDRIESHNNKLRGDGARWYLTAGANTRVLSFGDDFAAVVWSGTTGLFADLTGARLYSCASGIVIGEWVYASGADAVALTDADALATMPTIGRVTYKPTTTTCYVKNYGYAYDAAANSGNGDLWVVGDEYWVSTTAGEITTTMPAVWPQRAGIAVSTQRFKILIGDNLGLVHTNTFSCSGATEAVLEWVYISGADQVDEADASDPTKMPAIGMIVEKPTAIIAVVKTDGKVLTTGKGWTPNDPVYISSTTPGDIVRVPPGMGTVQRVGTVVHDDGGAVVDGLLIELM